MPESRPIKDGLTIYAAVFVFLAWVVFSWWHGSDQREIQDLRHDVDDLKARATEKGPP